MVPNSLSDYQFSNEHRQRWSLPKVVTEVSGLAVIDDDRLLIHDDETAIVFEFRISAQQAVPLFQLNQPALKVDLEGIAVLGDDVFLIASTGKIYKISNGLQRSGVITDFQVFDPGLENVCEVEGLNRDLNPNALVIACKRMLDKKTNHVSVFRYEPGKAPATKLFDLVFEDLASTGHKKIHPSGISTQFGSYIILSGRERLLLQVSTDGVLLATNKLKKKHHRQAEGIGFLPGGGVLIADEGGKRKGRITYYDTGVVR